MRQQNRRTSATPSTSAKKKKIVWDENIIQLLFAIAPFVIVKIIFEIKGLV